MTMMSMDGGGHEHHDNHGLDGNDQGDEKHDDETGSLPGAATTAGSAPSEQARDAAVETLSLEEVAARQAAIDEAAQKEDQANL